MKKKLVMVFGTEVLCLLLAIAGAAQEFTFTTVAESIVASKATLDLPGLTGNPAAIIVAMPIGTTQSQNPHPIGAWYYNNKWNIFNTDHATIAPGLRFNVQVFLQPGALQFLHVMTRDSFRGEGVSYIDNRALNNNPTARFTIFQNHAPDIRAGNLNKFDAKAEYDPTIGKWYIKNVNGAPLTSNTAYNIVITFAGSIGTSSPVSATSPTGGMPPTSGTNAPLTVIARETFVLPVDLTPLFRSQCKFKYYSNPNVQVTDSVIVTGQRSAGGDYLTWNALVGGNGEVLINVCYANPDIRSSPQDISLSNLKVNILVLR